MADISYNLKDTPKNVNNDKDNINNNEYLKKIQSKVKDMEFPSDFDAWTVQEQSDWVYRNITELYQYVPKSLENLVPAFFRSIDFDRSNEELPEWIDTDKYCRGQKFVRDNYFSVIFGILLGNIYGLTFDNGLKPLIISGRNNTPYLIFKRFLHTIIKILSWYNGEPWIIGTKAYKSMKLANARHLEIAEKLSRMSNEQIIAASKIADPLYCETFLKEFAIGCPFSGLEKRPYKVTDNIFTSKSINNATISTAQGSFIMLTIIYPQNTGIHGATDEDLEAFCYLWKCYGYFLGLQEEYNFCRGSLEEIKLRMWDLSRYWIKVNLTELVPEWIHLTRYFAESLNYYPFIYMTHNIFALLLVEALNLEIPNLYATLNYTEWIAYNFYKFFVRYAMKFSIVRKVANRLAHQIITRASNFGPDILAKLEERSKQYLLDTSEK